MRYLTAALLVIAACAYARGAFLLWRAAGIGRGISRRQVVAFAGAWTATFVALEEPTLTLAAESFAAHMIQHETLMLVAAPLFVIAQPLAAWSWALPSAWRGRVAEWSGTRALSIVWRRATRPVAATFIQLSVLWLWHAPRLFETAETDPWVHAAQHLSFFLSALCFWTAILAPSNRRGDWAKAALAFITMLGTGALGALLAFSRTSWYAIYTDADIATGLTPLETQQLGGLIMWIPGGLPYMAAALWIISRSLRFVPAARHVRAATPIAER